MEEIYQVIFYTVVFLIIIIVLHFVKIKITIKKL